MTLRFGKWTGPALALETAILAVLTAALLDYFVHRPEPMSVTTLLPGLTYATATIMKIYIFASLAAAVAGWIWPAGEITPAWAFTSIFLSPAAPLVGTFVVLLIQPSLLSMTSARDYEQTARIGALAMYAPVSLGAGAAFISLFRGERPVALAVLGLIVNALLIGLFFFFRFHALGFHQDNWAPR